MRDVMIGIHLRDRFRRLGKRDGSINRDEIEMEIVCWS